MRSNKPLFCGQPYVGGVQGLIQNYGRRLREKKGVATRKRKVFKD